MTFQSKLTPEQVKSLLRDWEDGYSPEELTIIYRVSLRTVYRKIAESNARRKRKRLIPKQRNRKKPGQPNQFTPEDNLKPCGTNAAYQRHRSKGEYPCTPCLEAHADDVAKAKRKKKSSDKKSTDRL